MKRIFTLILFILMCAISLQAQDTRKKVFGWITFDNTKWDAPYSNTNAMIPADSLPWSVMTHAGLFATNGTVPCVSRYKVQYPYFAARAHKSNVYAGLTIGGSGDGGFATFIQSPTNWPAWFTEYLGILDNAGLDFIEFDLESSYNVTTMKTFFAQLYDSLQVRKCGNNPAVKPFIVLTLGASRSISWVVMKPYVAFVNVMSYDYAQQGTWGRLVFDCAVTSYQYWNGTGINTDNFPGQGANSPAPSMQEMAKRLITAGWAANQVNVGFDVMPAHFWGGNFAGRGPTYIRESEALSSTPVSVDGSNGTIASMWNTVIAIPQDSIRFDAIANTYWAHTGKDLATDQLYTFTALPGLDGSMAAARKLVDSMGVGICFWNFGEEVWKTPVVPQGGRGWFFAQVNKYFNYGTVTPPPPPPPPPPILDVDGDGVPDAVDNCPNVVGPASNNGCPVVIPPPPPPVVCDTAKTRLEGYNDGYKAGKASVKVDSIATANYNKGYTAGVATCTVAPPPPPPPPPSTNVFIYQNSTLNVPWISSSWSATNVYNNSEKVVSGTSIKTIQKGWGAFGAHSGDWGLEKLLSTNDYKSITFSIYSPTTLSLKIYLAKSGWSSTGLKIIVQPNAWQTITVPVSQIAVANQTFYDIFIQNYTSDTIMYYLDEIALTK